MPLYDILPEKIQVGDTIQVKVRDTLISICVEECKESKVHFCRWLHLKASWPGSGGFNYPCWYNDLRTSDIAWRKRFTKMVKRTAVKLYNEMQENQNATN